MKFKIFAILIMLSTPLLAQIPSAGGGDGKRSEKDFQFLPIPYLNYDRSLGFSYGLLPMAMYNLNKKDTISPSSVSGLMAMGTTNGTWFGMAFNQFYLNEDTWRLTLVGGFGNVNFQFYPDLPLVPEVVDYTTGIDFFLIQVQRKIAKQMYGGIGYVFSNLETDFDLDPIPIPTQYVKLHGLRFVYSWDRRNNVYYPTSGTLIDLTYSVFPEFMNESSSNRLELEYNQYFAVPNEKDVIAARAYIGIGLGELDFNQQFIVGGGDLRGYSQGEYRGDQILAFQGEYRWNIAKRFGLVGFGGVATIFGSQTSDQNGKLLPSAGGGFRITAFEKNHFNIGMDAAVGIGDWGLEFRIGEAF